MLNKCLLLLPTGIVWFSLHVPSLCILQNINKSPSLTLSPCFPTSIPLPMIFPLHGMSLTYFFWTNPSKAYPALPAVLFAGSHPSQHVTHLCPEQVPAEVHGPMTPHQDWNALQVVPAWSTKTIGELALSSPRVGWCISVCIVLSKSMMLNIKHKSKARPQKSLSPALSSLEMPALSPS